MKPAFEGVACLPAGREVFPAGLFMQLTGERIEEIAWSRVLVLPTLFEPVKL